MLLPFDGCVTDSDTAHGRSMGHLYGQIRYAVADGRTGLCYSQQELPFECREGGSLSHPLFFRSSDYPISQLALLISPLMLPKSEQKSMFACFSKFAPPKSPPYSGRAPAMGQRSPGVLMVLPRAATPLPVTGR